nr:hypothetical protein [Cyclobacteriaceae bacterium]
MVNLLFRYVIFLRVGCVAIVMLPAFCTTTHAQIMPDSVVVDSLEVEAAFDEILYKEDSININFYSLPANFEYIPGNDDPLVIADRLKCIQKEI